MRTVIQRVKEASVKINGEVHAVIGRGLLVLVGIEHEDGVEDAEWLVKKISQLRIFDDDKGVMNLSVNDIRGEVLVVSQFTLHAKTKKGNRPSYVRAAPPEKAIPLYEDFLKQMEQHVEGNVMSGVFGARMDVALINEGPVTILIDTKKKE